MSQFSIRTPQSEPKLCIRLPDGVRQRLKVAAAQNRRTMNAEAVLAIEHWLALAHARDSERAA